jgi:5-formyltetrahydrofolate cyclo-ligase
MESDGDIRLWRRQQRERLIAARLAVDTERHGRWSKAIERRLAALLDTLPGRVIGFYWPHQGEFDARPLADRLIKQGRSVALPAIVKRRGPLEFRAWRPDAEMETGTYGIPVPKCRHVLVPDILVVPLLGFDARNYRLGYGGGYFDRTLAALVPRPVAVGVGFELSRLASIFPQPYDVAMDFIVTEAELRPAERQGPH